MLFLGLFLFASPGASQNPQAHWHQFTTEDGLSSMTVYHALQDSKGFMWFATEQGICRFNGYTFERFPGPDDVNFRDVFVLREDALGRVWFNTMLGGLYFVEQDSIIPYAFNELIESLISGLHLNVDFAIEGNGDPVFVNIKEQGVLEIDKDGNSHWHRIKDQPAFGLIDIGPALFQFSTLFLGDNKQLSDLEEKGLRKPIELHTEDSIRMIHDFHCQESKGNRVEVLKLGKGGYLIFYFNELHYVKNGTILWELYYPFDLVNLLQNQSGEIVTCEMNNGGLKVYADLEAVRLGQYRQLLGETSVTYFVEDKFGGLWATSYGDGIYYAPAPSVKIFNNFSDFTESTVEQIVVKNDQVLFLRIDNGDVYEFNTCTFTSRRLPRRPGRGDASYLFYNTESEALWVSHDAIYRWEDDKLSPPFILQETNSAQLLTLGSFVHHSLDKKDLWIIYSSILARWNFEKGNFEIFNTPDDEQQRFSHLLESKSGRIWLANNDGLMEWLRDEQMAIYPEDLPVELKTGIKCMEELSGGSLAVGTLSQGLFIWNESELHHINLEHGLSSNTVSNIHIDQYDNIWVGTSHGLNKIFLDSLSEWQVRKYTIAHGLPSNEILDIQSTKDCLWIGTANGLLSLPLREELDLYSPTPIINSFSVNSKSHPIKASQHFKAWQNNLTINYLSISYNQFGKVPYRYRLNAKDDWFYSSQSRVNFPALSPGSYNFEVQSKNRDSLWSASALLPFTINPPLWQQTWFLLLLVLILTVSLVTLYRWRIKQIRREATLASQLTEMELNALRSQMNPHFIFNALNSIQRFVVEGDKLNSSRYLSRFAKLIRATLKNSRKRSISLEEDLISIENYLELERMRFKNRFDYAIQLGDEVDPSDIEIPSMLVQPFLENAILHGFVKKKEQGKLLLDYQIEEFFLKITITDNGIGIEQSKKQKGQTAHESLGLSISKRRLEMHGKGVVKVDNLRIEELYDEAGNTLGTKVVLMVPI